jgi:hypothetical protein
LLLTHQTRRSRQVIFTRPDGSTGTTDRFVRHVCTHNRAQRFGRLMPEVNNAHDWQALFQPICVRTDGPATLWL